MNRPKTRGDCIDGPRPCPWVSCRHHLGVDLFEKPLRVVEHEGWEERETCSLDVADAGESSMRTIAYLMGMKHQRVDQIERTSIIKLQRMMQFRGITAEDFELDEMDSMRERRTGHHDRHSHGYLDAVAIANALRGRVETRADMEFRFTNRFDSEDE